MKKRKNDNNIKIAFAVCVCILAAFFIWEKYSSDIKKDYYEKTALEEKKQRKQLENEQMIRLECSDQWELNEEGFESAMTSDEMIENASLSSGYGGNKASVTFDISGVDFGENDLYMAEFIMYTEETSAAVAIRTGSGSARFYITTSPSAFYLPVTGDSLSISLLDEFQGTHICNAEIVKVEGGASVYSGLKYGQYDLTEYAIYELEENRITDHSARDVLTNNVYLFALLKDELKIYDIQETGAEIGSLKNLGNTRHMDFVDSSTIVITSRENGVYFIDVSDPQTPGIISTYNSLDLATGVKAENNCVFVCSRYYGVEILDVTNIYEPKLLSVIHTDNECIQCDLYGDYMYISNWNAKKVYVYDISNLSSPEQVNVIETDGNPYGVVAQNTTLFIATGHHSSNSSTNRNSFGYGAGHGMEIYDITEPEIPKWQSTVKSDGRLYYPGSDSWGIYVNGNYVFLSDTYNGVFVYDVTDRENPKRVSRIEKKLYTKPQDASSSTADVSVAYNDEKYIFPYNPEEYIGECFGGIGFSDGVVYLAGQESGLYSLDMNDISWTDKEYETYSVEDVDYLDTLSIGQIKNYKATTIDGVGTVNSVDFYQDYFVLACGDDGVSIVDIEGRIIQNIPTNGPAKDVLVYDNKLYIAEGNYGIELYDLDQNSVMSFYKCMLRFETISQLSITSDGKYLLAQDGWTRIKTFDISANTLSGSEDITTGTLYFRNLIKQNASKKIVGYASSKEIALFSENDGIFSLDSTIDNAIYEERNGLCEYNGEIIAIYKNGYIVLDPDNLAENSLVSEESIRYLRDYKIKGKVCCYDGILVATDPYSRQVIIVNIEDINNPSVIEYFQVDGSVDVAQINDRYICIPLKYQGLLILER